MSTSLSLSNVAVLVNVRHLEVGVKKNRSRVEHLSSLLHTACGQVPFGVVLLNASSEDLKNQTLLDERNPVVVVRATQETSSYGCKCVTLNKRSVFTLLSFNLLEFLFGRPRFHSRILQVKNSICQFERKRVSKQKGHLELLSSLYINPS